MSKWFKTLEVAPPENLPIRFYNAEWIDEFNPTGTTEGLVLGDGEGYQEFMAPMWDNDQDYWKTEEGIFPSHWSYIEEVVV
jgi:hypothetical protein